MDLHTDGAARGNPGPAGGGAVLSEAGKTVSEKAKFFGKKTNNESEYLALVEGLKLAKAAKVKSLKVYMDSQLIVRQMKGEYRIKSKNLLPIWKQALALSVGFDKIEFFHIKRELNRRADQLANQAIDSAL
ncbi:MAG: ribonuclease HI family protein [Candidatus Altiarchaeota archaeon]|nr:ribonuclease HI family protein [Candidatus Altiarchaeota archaeon]